jgi:hypothetical protein
VANGAATNQIRCVCNSISQPKRSGLTTSGESHSDVEVLGCENIDGAITKRGHCNSCPSGREPLLRHSQASSYCSHWPSSNYTLSILIFC